jgi:hypothetical protein
VQIALWGARSPEQLDPLDDVMGWSLDDDALSEVDAIVNQRVTDPVGPEFMAPPARTTHRSILSPRSTSPEVKAESSS